MHQFYDYDNFHPDRDASGLLMRIWIQQVNSDSDPQKEIVFHFCIKGEKCYSEKGGLIILITVDTVPVTNKCRTLRIDPCPRFDIL